MKRSKVTGIVGTAVLHLLLLALLLWIAIRSPQPQEEGGVPVMLGSAELSRGDADPYALTDVDILPASPAAEASEPEALPETPPAEEIMTQAEEETVAIPKKEAVKAEKEAPRPKEKAEAGRRAEAEKARAEQQAAAEKAAAEAASKTIAGAFGKGTRMGDKGAGDAGAGAAGSPAGNAAEGKSSGEGGYGTFDLNGRSLGSGGLPMPVYNVQDEGRVVVTITVNPAGQVVGTSINKRTNTVNAALRRAAEEAARKARFNSVDGVNNQTGTITYYFKLK